MLQFEKTDADERGAVFIFILVIAVVLLGVSALSMDVSVARLERQRMQTAADAGALAGVLRLIEGSTGSAAATEAASVASGNYGQASWLLAEYGSYVNGTFTANAGNPTAIRVRARRSVQTFFGKIWGQNFLDPNVKSIASINRPSSADCVVPYAVEQGTVDSHQYGDVIAVESPSSGNWGKVDLGINASCGNCFHDAIVNGVCNRTVRVGDQLSPGTGFAQVDQGFRDRADVNPYVTIPVVTDFPNGNSSTVTVVGFIAVELVNTNGRGAHWTGNIRFLNRVAGQGNAGSPGEPYSKTRSLME